MYKGMNGDKKSYEEERGWEEEGEVKRGYENRGWFGWWRGRERRENMRGREGKKRDEKRKKNK